MSSKGRRDQRNVRIVYGKFKDRMTHCLLVRHGSQRKKTLSRNSRESQWSEGEEDLRDAV